MRKRQSTLTTLALLLTASLTYAQDNIVLKSGEEIPAKVLEVNQLELKYKKTANPDGPIYTAPLREVFFIKYANGSKDVFGAQPSAGTAQAAVSTPLATSLDGLRYQSRWFSRRYVNAANQPLTMGDVETQLQQQSDALTAFQKGRARRTWSVVLGTSAVALVGAGAVVAGNRAGGGRGFDGRASGDDRNGRDSRRGNWRVGTALAGGGVLVGLAAIWLDHRATVQFRRAADRYNTAPKTTLSLMPAQEGLGAALALRF